MSVLSGSEETERRVYTRGMWALHHRGLHRSSGVSLPHGLALGVGLHPWVNTTLHSLPLYPHLHFLIDIKLCLPIMPRTDRHSVLMNQNVHEPVVY